MKIECKCSICWDFIENDYKNITITECSHTFHSKCLIDMMAHGSFKCPECRYVMGIKKDETISDYDSEFDTDSDLDNSFICDENPEFYSDFALRGLRFFTNNLLGNNHARTDLEDEKKNYIFDNDDLSSDDNEPYSDYNLRGLRLFTNNLMKCDHTIEDILDEQEDTMPSPHIVSEYLLKQNISYDDLVNCILNRCFYKYVEIKEPLKSGKMVIKNINNLIAEHKNL